jgi:hypothetical protein
MRSNRFAKLALRPAPDAARALRNMALLAAIAACGPHVHPDEPDHPPPPPRAVTPKHPGTPPGKGVLVGEMCPQGAAGNPGVDPLVMRGVDWTADADDVADAVDRSAHAFAIAGTDGTRAGVFQVLGTADLGNGGDVAVGSYTGRPPCQPASRDGDAKPDPACVAATGGCGIAVASIDPASADEGAPDLELGTVCAAGDSLLVDIDGDGATESFPIATFIDGVRAPSEEVDAAPVVGAACNDTHALYGLTIVPESDGTKSPDDAKYQVALDVLAATDLDGDGKKELVVQLRYSDNRTIAIYSPEQIAGRLELVGEAVPWQ